MDQSLALIRLDKWFAERALHFSRVKKEEALIEVLAQVMASARMGNLCLPLEHLKKGVSLLQEQQEKLASFIRIDRKSVYLEKNWAIERILEKEMMRLSKQPSLQIKASICEMPLNEEQRHAVAVCLENRLSLLTGGPGTGKTYTAAAMMESFDPKREKNILLAAPTGKAAEQLAQTIFKATGRNLQSATLHKWLHLGRAPPWPKEDVHLKADLLLIDECSMIDAPLFATLLKAIPADACTVLMGDPNQLSPVGIGSVFADFVRSNYFSIGKACLTKSMRTESPQILRLAEDVLQGKIPEGVVLPWPNSEQEFFRYLAQSLQPILGESMAVKPSLESLYAKLSRLKIVNCLRQGPFGADAINDFFSEKVRQEAKPGQWWWMPIMITNNDERTGLSNGEMGIYLQKQGDRATGLASFPKKEREIPLAGLPAFEPAFCSSVHKSQGSEYDDVIVIVPMGSEKFGKEMLYTAITRARQKVSLVANRENIEDMLSRSLIKYSGILS